MDCVVAPLDHRYELPAFACSTTLPPEQSVVDPCAVMEAEVTATLVIATEADVVEHPDVLVAVTV